MRLGLSLRRKGALGLPDWATYSGCPEPHFGPPNKLETLFPLAIGHQPASKNLLERSGPGMGQNLDTVFIIHSKSIY